MTEMPRTERRLGDALLLAGAGATLLVAGAVIGGHLGGPDRVRVVDDAAQGIEASLAAFAAGRAARRQVGRTRRGWAILAVGLALWAAGQALWCWWEIVENRPAPFPSLADAGFLGFSVAATVAVCLMGGEGDSAGRARRLLDGLIVAGGLVIISWCTALGATLHAGGALTFPLMVSLAYPVADITLLTMTVQMLGRVPGHRWSLVVLGAATASLAVADSSFAYLSAVGRYHTGSAPDLGWIAGFALVSAAAVVTRPPVGGPEPGTARPLIVLPYGVLLATGATIGVQALGGRRPDGTEAAAITAVIVAVLARQYLALRDNQVLVRAVEAREAELSHQAFHDPLTGLPNRALFADRVAHALEYHRSQGRPLAVVYFDLDDFKGVNDTLGHAAGDELLGRVAERIRGAVTPGDTLARLGGDEFAVLLEGADGVGLAQQVGVALREPFTLQGRRTFVGASVGVVGVGPDAPTPTPSDLMAMADTAMYTVKRSGKAGTAVYQPDMRQAGHDDLDLREAVGAAVVAGRIATVFQPIVDPVTGAVHAVETLARWAHGGEPVGPDVFVPLAERLGLAPLLTDTVLESAAGELARWSALLGHHDLRVSVNVSPQEFADHELVTRVHALLSRHDIHPDQLILEVTESAVTNDLRIDAAVLAELRRLGVHLALDDFGVGLSSLGRLQRLPFDYLKIDRSMVIGIDTDPTRAQVLTAVTQLGDTLGMRVIAEGVETAGQLAALERGGRPPLIQGYLFGRPGPPASLDAALHHAPAARA